MLRNWEKAGISVSHATGINGGNGRINGEIVAHCNSQSFKAFSRLELGNKQSSNPVCMAFNGHGILKIYLRQRTDCET